MTAHEPAQEPRPMSPDLLPPALDDPEAFDLCGPLPSGTTVLEASAGTGKTYAITALAVRFVAEGRVRLDQVMMVTFTRAATGELRHRVHARLHASLAALDAWLADGSTPADEVDRHLVDAPREEVLLRRNRLRAALADVDAATIATTHEFCQRMLTGLGLLVDHDRTSVFVDNTDELARQVVGDVYLAHEVVDGSDTPPAKLATFARYAEAGRAALHEPDAELVPQESDGLSADRVGYAQAVRDQFEARKRRSGIYTFDDMVHRLRLALVDPVTGEDAAQALSERYRLVLIDEFQDTDPAQWEIVGNAFVGRSTVVLIGDPKQAIYAFRGADVNAYLAAVEVADHVFTLGTNHRSDAGVVQGVLDVYAGVAMGSERIVARQVRARHEQPRLLPPSGRAGAPVQVRCLRSNRPMSAFKAADAVNQDLADLVVGLLTDGWQVQADDGSWRPVQPSDIAVLVRANRRGARVRDALERAGVPSVFGGASSVMTSEAARAWLDLLRALAEPSNVAMKRAALSVLIGWDEQRLAAAVGSDGSGGQASERGVSDLAVRMKLLGRVLHRQGVAGVFEALCAGQGESVGPDRDRPAADSPAEADGSLYERLLRRPDGERLMTDLRHVAQLLNDAAVRQELSPVALAEWLQGRIEEAWGSADDDRTRRLETDASCVQVMTIHAAKGLEFPIVLLPEAANEWTPEPRPGTPSVYHLDGRRVLDLGVDLGWQHRQEVRLAQERGESLRTLYVAMTRAKSRLVMWWAPTKDNTASSALHRLLQGPRRPGAEPDASYPLPQDPTHVAGLDPRRVELVAVEQARPRRWQPSRGGAPRLEARAFTRTVDGTWRRTSYSGLTADVHGLPAVEGAAPEGSPVVVDDEVALDELAPEERGPAALVPGALPTGSLPPAPAEDPELARVGHLAELPGGTQFGSLVHGVLEVVDATSDTLLDDLRAQVDHLAARLPVDGLDPAELAEGLADVVRTPLGSLGDGIRLCDVAPADHLAELDFELPMGSDGPGGWAATLQDLAVALQDDSLTGGDAFAVRYGAHLQASPVADKTLRGFLTGSIDVVLRTPADASGRRRHVVLDYKTNRMPVPQGEQLTVGHYLPEQMAQAMIEAHYPLQALLYSVALHRFLAWRLPGYRPEHDLGGIGYLFVRGMVGADTPVRDGMPCGVFTWHPAPALVVRLSELVGGLR